MSIAPKKCYSVVVVDDCEDDRFFLRRTISQFPRFKLVHELGDGEEAVGYLAGNGQFGNRKAYPLPDLLLLDIKMPRMNGFDVLRWMKSQSFPSLTVIVLSSSILQLDVEASLGLGAHGFWSKTGQFEQMRRMAVEIEALLDGRSASHAKTQK